jgi:uncharacterized SAM-binding protein YcdF (DUF218 family)
MPIPLACLVVLVGLVLWLTGRRRASRGLMTGAGLFILVLAWWPVAEALLAPLEERYPSLLLQPVSSGAIPDLDPDRDSVPAPDLDPADPRGPGTRDEVAAVVLLGGGWWADAARPITSQLNQNSAIRLFEGLRLLRALPGARLVVSGGSRTPEQPPSALGYAQAARDMGVPPEHILVLDGPLDTAQEARAVREALGGGSPLILVTSAAHMPRAMRHFQAVGLDPIPAPTQHLTGRGRPTSLLGWLPSSNSLRKSETAWHEYLGLLAWRWDHPR